MAVTKDNNYNMHIEKQKITLTFPDGTKKQFSNGINGEAIAESISKSLVKKAVAIKVNNIKRDLSDCIYADADIKILTVEDQEGLEIMRHTLTAQVLARALKKLFPSSKLAIGPVIENGFYYDFMYTHPISSDDLPSIEKEMKSIINEGRGIQKVLKSKKEAIALFKNKKEFYKVKIIEESEQEEKFQIYCQEGTEFFDLCYGPHLPSLKHIGAFKLTKVSGAYWKGDSKNEMLQRIYGTAWKNKDDLEKHLTIIREAEKRDHRVLGKNMDLFHFQEEAPGAVFWHPKGWKVFQKLISYMRDKQEKAGYLEINTPEILDRVLWEKSGHWDKFGENMFTSVTKEDKTYAIKPMNCPGGIQIFNQGIRSYKELPYKISEFGKVHRYEPSGALHGLMRVRAFTQDDAHIFCSEHQIESECKILCDLITKIYNDFGFNEIMIKYSDRPKKRVGSDQVWDKAEHALLTTIKKIGLPYKINSGEGAFYGPKLEFVLRDAIGRDWQCGTVQIDLNLPERLACNFIDKSGEKQMPVLIHRALFGSLERFIGILLEHYSGNLPLWISPLEVIIATISEKYSKYAEDIQKKLKLNKISAEIDDRNEKIGYKIRQHSNGKIPIILIVGEKEVENKNITVRRLGSKEFKNFALDDFIKEIKSEKSFKND